MSKPSKLEARVLWSLRYDLRRLRIEANEVRLARTPMERESAKAAVATWAAGVRTAVFILEPLASSKDIKAELRGAMNESWFLPWSASRR